MCCCCQTAVPTMHRATPAACVVTLRRRHRTVSIVQPASALVGGKFALLVLNEFSHRIVSGNERRTTEPGLFRCLNNKTRYPRTQLAALPGTWCRARLCLSELTAGLWARAPQEAPARRRGRIFLASAQKTNARLCQPLSALKNKFLWSLALARGLAGPH